MLKTLEVTINTLGLIAFISLKTNGGRHRVKDREQK